MEGLGEAVVRTEEEGDAWAVVLVLGDGFWVVLDSEW